MALNDTLKTRILLRNDALTTWNSSQLVLAKGELAIATGLDGRLAEVRVGNNSTWANSLKLRVEATQISGLIDTIDTEISGKANVYQIVANGSTPNSWKLQTKAISSNTWTDVGSAFTVDFSALTANIDALSRKIDATNATLKTVSSDYLKAADKTELKTLVGTVSNETLVSAKAYTDKAVADLNIGNYALSTDVDSLVEAVSAKTLVSANSHTDNLVKTVSAETLVSANAYTDKAVADLSIDNYIKHGEVVQADLSGYFIFDCGGASLRANEPNA